MKISKMALTALTGTIIFLGQSPIVSAETIGEVLISYTDGSDRRQVIENYAKSASDSRVNKDLKNPDRCLILMTSKQFNSINATHPKTLAKFLEMYVPGFLDRSACTVGKFYKPSRSQVNSQRNEFSDLEDRLKKLVSLKERGLITEKEYQEKKKHLVKEVVDRI